MNQGYWAVLPANIRYHTELTQTAKLLYAEVSALAQADGYCWATDTYLAETLGCSVATVTRSLRKLRDLGFIRCEKTTNAKGTERHIFCGVFAMKGGMVKNDDTVDDTLKNDDTPTLKNDDTPTVKNDDTPPSTQYNRNIKSKNIRARKEKNHSPEVEAAINSIFDSFSGEDMELRAKIEELCEDRAEVQGYPVDTVRIANGIVNALKRYSGGDHAIMIYLLAKAIDGHWRLPYPLRSWEKEQRPWLDFEAASTAQAVAEWRPGDED